jgi:hypothetical protein
MMTKQEIADLVESLKRERDELHLQLHLFKADAHDEWLELEKKWANFQHKAEAVATTAGHAAADVGAVMRLLGNEVGAGYRKIRESLRGTV